MTDDRAAENETLAYLQANERSIGVAERQRAFFRACESGHEKVARWLIDRKLIDINGKDASGETCLHHALQKYGNTPLVEMLVENGADVNAAGRNGETPLMRAMWASREAALFFIQHGGDVGAKWTQDKSLLHLASSTASMEILKALLDKGVDIDIRDSTGATPLHDAVASQAAEAVAYLVSRGADVRAQVKKGYQSALLSGDPAHPTISYVEFAEGAGTLHLAALGGSQAIAQALTEKGAEVGMSDTMGNQPIHYAAMNPHEQMLQFLLRAGADPKARNRLEVTPLHYACSFSDDSDEGLERQAAAIKLLTAEGADINARASGGETPMDLVASPRARGYLRAHLGI
jgi:ankyrin repeat protein